MRINNQAIPGIHKAYEQQKKPVGVNNGLTTTKKDDLEVSSEARLWGLATKALKELPEPNNNLAELQKTVATGTYEVNSEVVAEKIWQENVFDQKI